MLQVTANDDFLFFSSGFAFVVRRPVCFTSVSQREVIKHFPFLFRSVISMVLADHMMIVGTLLVIKIRLNYYHTHTVCHTSTEDQNLKENQTEL